MKVLNIAKRFGRDDRGMETVEWAIMAAILVAGLVGVISGIGNNVLTKFTVLSDRHALSLRIAGRFYQTVGQRLILCRSVSLCPTPSEEPHHADDIMEYPRPMYQWGVVIVVSLVAAAWDARTHRIPNWLTGSMFLAGMAWAITQGGFRGLGDGAVGCVLAALPFLLPFIFAGGGAADAKLMGALGMWLGARNGLALLLCVTVSGAILGIGYSVLRGSFRSVIANLMAMAGVVLAVQSGQVGPTQAKAGVPARREMQPMPYGLSIFVGTCVALLVVGFWKSGRLI